jgi:hypothetical protein
VELLVDLEGEDFDPPEHRVYGLDAVREFVGTTVVGPGKNS